eukprot:3142536-Pyramimonas_sp.AAC.1
MRVKELRKDRKFGGKGGGKGPGSSSSGGKKCTSSLSKGNADKMNSDCHARGEKGHWTGDARCPKLQEWKAEQAK